MAIQESDIMDFGNGIIGDDTFDVWRKKTNSLKGEIDAVNTTLTAKINTDVAALRPLYIPIAGSATAVSTSLQFISAVNFTSAVNINGSTLTGSSDKLVSNREFDSSIQLTSPKVKASSKLILGTKEYTVPSSPAINNAVLTSATTAGQLQWRNAAELFQDAGGLQQTTAVFEEVMPVGAVIACAEDPNDPNFLLCEGGSVSKEAYPKLYDVLKAGGTTARYGETTTAFTLPDYSGRVLVGTGTAGNVNFGNTFGVDGGDTNTSTSGVALTTDQIPSHNHTIPTIKRTGYDTTGGGSAYGQDSSTGAGPNLTTNSTGGDSEGDTTAHSHSITTANRIQPYVTVEYYIKAIENSKVDFKINVNNSGLKSTDGGGVPQTLISVSNQTHSLSINPDNTSIALDNNFKVSVKSSPTIQGTITATGNVISDEPTQSNHLATKNYVDNRQDTTRGNFKKETETESGKHNSVSPQYVQSYCYIDDEDNVVFFGELAGGKNVPRNAYGTYYNSQTFNVNYVPLTKLILPDNEKADKLYKSFHNTYVISKSGKAYSIGLGYSAASITLVTSPGYGLDDQRDNRYYTWTRAFCGSNNCKISKIIVSADQGNETAFALDTNGYLWGHGTNTQSVLANGTQHSTWEINGTTKTLSATTLKRFELLNSETLALGADKAYALDTLSAQSAYRLSQVMNHFLDAAGQITHDPALAVGLLKVTDSCVIGGFIGFGTGPANQSNTYTTTIPTESIAILGEDKRVYVAGFGVYGQCGAGNNLNSAFWTTVSTSQGVPLENITKVYAGGQKRGTFFVALDENHDAWAWGYGPYGNFANGLFGIASNELLYATRIWDSSVRNRRANYVITQTSGGGYSNFATNQQGQAGTQLDVDGTLIIASHENSAGGTIDKEFYMRNDSGSAIVQINHTVFNTTAYSIQELYHSNGPRLVGMPVERENNFYYVLARNKNTNMLELWSSGSNFSFQSGFGYSGNGAVSGALGSRSPSSTSSVDGADTDWRSVAYRVNFSSELLEKVVTIHCSVAAGSFWANNTTTNGIYRTRETATYIYLSDGRIFASGHALGGPFTNQGIGNNNSGVGLLNYSSNGSFAPIEMHL